MLSEGCFLAAARPQTGEQLSRGITTTTTTTTAGHSHALSAPEQVRTEGQSPCASRGLLQSLADFSHHSFVGTTRATADKRALSPLEASDLGNQTVPFAPKTVRHPSPRSFLTLVDLAFHRTPFATALLGSAYHTCHHSSHITMHGKSGLTMPGQPLLECVLDKCRSVQRSDDAHRIAAC